MFDCLYPIPRPDYKVISRNQVITLSSNKTTLMGILNASYDSFSGDGFWSTAQDHQWSDTSKQQLLSIIQRMIDAGVDIIDIGGESTRPGSEPLTIKVELQRVMPLILAITENFDIPISIDTYKPEVAAAALKAGACMVNCIQGTPVDPALVDVVREHDAALILMHIRGTPKTMQDDPCYADVIDEITHELETSLTVCREQGLSDEQLIIDPGIGFGKTVEHNFVILKNIWRFHRLGQPILVGPSRKSFIGKLLNKDTQDRLAGTLAATVIAAQQGAHIIRVHDLIEVGDALKVSDQMRI